jgi:hypothetical protein
MMAASFTGSSLTSLHRQATQQALGQVGDIATRGGGGGWSRHR